MGRFATSLVAISIVLGTLPVGQLRLYGMQDAESVATEVVQETNVESGVASPVEKPAQSVEDSTTANQTPATPEAPSTGNSGSKGSDKPLNPASPSNPTSLTSNGGSASAASNGAVAPPSVAGAGDGSSPPPKEEVSGSKLDPSEISFQVGTPAADPGKEFSFYKQFLGNPLNLVLLAFVVLYVFLLLIPKPGAKERKLQQQRLASLKKNDRVVLISGIHGVVSNINTEAGTVTIRVDESSNAKITVDRVAIRSVVA